MHIRSLSVLALVAGCGGSLRSQTHDSTVVSAEKDRRNVELEAYRARAEWQRSTALDRAVGRMPGLPTLERGAP